MEKLLLESASTQEIQDKTKAIDDLTTQYAELNKEMDKSQNESEEEISEDTDWIQSAIKKPGSLSKELGVPEEDNIPSSLINKEIKKLKKKDKDPKKKGIQGLSKRNLSKFRKLNLAKTLKNL